MSVGLHTSVELLGVMGDSTRVRLLALLDGYELTVAELTAITELGQSRVSTHLGRLRDAGLLRDRREGSLRYYRLQTETLSPEAARLWTAVRSDLHDAVLDGDRDRRSALLQSRAQEGSWIESIAGRMEHHYSPGRTWEALTRGLLGFVGFGDVLDVGCGDGMVAQLLAPHAKRYVALDRSEKLLAAASKRLSKNDNVSMDQGDMHALPFDDGSFDQVLLLHVLTYARDAKQAVREGARVLREGGRLAIATLAAHPHQEIAERYGHLNRGFEVDEVRGFLEGLSVRLCDVTSRERREPHFRVITAFADKPKGASA